MLPSGVNTNNFYRERLWLLNVQEKPLKLFGSYDKKPVFRYSHKLTDINEIFPQKFGWKLSKSCLLVLDISKIKIFFLSSWLVENLIWSMPTIVYNRNWECSRSLLVKRPSIIKSRTLVCWQYAFHFISILMWNQYFNSSRQISSEALKWIYTQFCMQ